MFFFFRKKKKRTFFFKIEDKIVGENVTSKINRLFNILKKINQIIFLYLHQKMLHGY